MRKSLYDKVISNINLQETKYDSKFFEALLEIGCESVSIETFKRICSVGDWMIFMTKDDKFESGEVIDKCKNANLVMIKVKTLYPSLKIFKDAIDGDLEKGIVKFGVNPESLYYS